MPDKNEGRQEENKLRDITEILFAHDVLDRFLSGRLPLVPEKKEHSLWVGCLIALCWTLHHSYGNKLGENIEKLLAECEKQGYKWVDVSDLKPHDRVI